MLKEIIKTVYRENLELAAKDVMMPGFGHESSVYCDLALVVLDNLNPSIDTPMRLVLYRGFKSVGELVARTATANDLNAHSSNYDSQARQRRCAPPACCLPAGFGRTSVTCCVQCAGVHASCSLNNFLRLPRRIRSGSAGRSSGRVFQPSSSILKTRVSPDVTNHNLTR